VAAAAVGGGGLQDVDAAADHRVAARGQLLVQRDAASLVSFLVSFTPVRHRSPAAGMSQFEQVTDGGSRR